MVGGVWIRRSSPRISPLRNFVAEEVYLPLFSNPHGVCAIFLIRVAVLAFWLCVVTSQLAGVSCVCRGTTRRCRNVLPSTHLSLATEITSDVHPLFPLPVHGCSRTRRHAGRRCSWVVIMLSTFSYESLRFDGGKSFQAVTESAPSDTEADGTPVPLI